VEKTLSQWTQSDIRKLIDAALDAFAVEFFDVTSFRSLSRKDKLKICRALKADAATRFAYEWMMRGVK
jgi:hypothetical protein